MYLAKFFHRPPGNDDRELLLIPESHCAGSNRPIVMGIVLTDPDKQFIHEDYPTVAEAIAAFRYEAQELREQGYVETAHTDYTLRNLLPDPATKPNWQRSLDELLLALFGEDAGEQSRLIEELAGTRAADEPLYLWIVAYRAAAIGSLDTDRLLALTKEALSTFATR